MLTAIKRLVINLDNLLSLEFRLIGLNKVEDPCDKSVYFHLRVPLRLAKHFDAATVDKTSYDLERAGLSQPVIFEVNLEKSMYRLQASSQ